MGYYEDIIVVYGNSGSENLTIHAISWPREDAAFSVGHAPLPIVIPPGGSTALTFRFAPAELGRYAAVVELTDNGSSSAQLRMTGRGTAAPEEEDEVEEQD